jgi:hypothetical protein
MEKAKGFILKFLAKEADCWTRLELDDLNAFNLAVSELYDMAIDNLDESLGILQRSKLDKEEVPTTYKPRHLYKLSSYKNKIYGDIWVAYASSTTTDTDPKYDTIFEAFIISEIENELKIIGTMTRHKNRLTMIVQGWKGSVYNPSNLDIKKLGKFVATERYFEPGNYDNFSLNEYLKDN